MYEKEQAGKLLVIFGSNAVIFSGEWMDGNQSWFN